MENTPLFYSAAAIARNRLEQYVEERLAAEAKYSDDEAWRFYTYLLEQAKKFSITHSGYRSFEYRDDCAEAVKNCREEREKALAASSPLPPRRTRKKSIIAPEEKKHDKSNV